MTDDKKPETLADVLREQAVAITNHGDIYGVAQRAYRAALAADRLEEKVEREAMRSENAWKLASAVPELEERIAALENARKLDESNGLTPPILTQEHSSLERRVAALEARLAALEKDVNG